MIASIASFVRTRKPWTVPEVSIIQTRKSWSITDYFVLKITLLIIGIFFTASCFADPTDDIHECAIKKGDISCVKNAIASGANVNAYGPESGNTALMRAAMFGMPQIAKLLLENGARHDLLSKNEATPKWSALEIAARQGSLGVVKEIIKAGSNPSGDTARNSTPLRAAINGGHYDIAQWLIEQGADPAVENASGANAMDSLLSQPSEILKRNEVLLLLFFEKGVYPRSSKIKWSDSEQGSFLCHAINEQLFGLAEKLVQKGLFINEYCSSITPSTKERFESTPLYIAISGSEKASVKNNDDVKLEQKWSHLRKPDQYARLSLLLIDHDANVNARVLHSDGGWLSTSKETLSTPLEESLRIKNRPITLSLLRKGARLADGSTMADVRRVAMKEKWTDIVKALSEVSDENQIPNQLSAIVIGGVSSSARIKSPANDEVSFQLAKAVLMQDADKLNKTIASGADVNYVIGRDLVGVGEQKLGDMTPLGLALMSGQTKVANLLLAKGANANTEQTCILGKVDTPYGTAEKLTPWYPSDVPFDSIIIKCSSVLVAVNNRLNSVVVELLTRGVNVNSDYLPFGSILNYSLFDNNVELTRSLLKQGAHVSAQGIFGKLTVTPFQLAISFGKDTLSDEIAIEILDKGGDVGPHLDGRPALHYAIDKNNQRMLLKLLSKKIDPNAADSRGKTPLIYAAEKNRKAMIVSLRKAGAKEPRSYDLAREAANNWSFTEAEYWLGIGEVLHYNGKLKSEISQVIQSGKLAQAEQAARERAAAASSYASTHPACNSDDVCWTVIEQKPYEVKIKCLKGSRTGEERRVCANGNGKWASGCGITDSFAHHYTFEKSVKIACDL